MLFLCANTTRRWFVLLICSGVLFFAFPVYGFQLEFPKDTFGLEGSAKTLHAILSNKEDSIQAVEIAMKTRTLDMYGNETLEDTDDFDIYPSQVLVAPGEDADVVIVWKGAAPDRELTYRLEAKEVPFQASSEFRTGAIQLTVGRRYLYAAYVTPPGVRPSIRLDSMRRETNDKGADELVVVLTNAGTAHQILKRFDISIEKILNDSQASLLVSPQTVSDPIFQSRFNIFPGGVREFRIPWPENLPKGTPYGVVSNVK